MVSIAAYFRMDAVIHFVERMRKMSIIDRAMNRFRRSAPAPRFEIIEPRVLFNAAPFAEQDNLSVLNDGAAIVLDLLANDTDADGDALRIESITDPQLAAAEIADDGLSVLLTPQSGQSGFDFFTYTIADGNGETNLAYVVLDLSLPATANNRPFAEQDAFDVVNDGSAVAVDVLANDRDPDDDTLSVSAILEVQSGSVEIVNGNTRFTPAPGFSGQDFFVYKLSDGNGGTDTAYSVIQVALPQDANNLPFAAQDAFNVANNGQAIALDVLANDSDPDGDSLSVSAILEVQSGSVEIVDGNTRYTPAPGFTGQDFYVYELSDGKGGTDTAYSVIQVAAGNANTQPFANLDSVTVTQGDAEIVIDVTLNDNDADGDPLRASQILTPPGAGTARIQNGLVYYTAPSGLIGGDPFIVQITDGQDGFDSANVNVLIENAVPVANDDTAEFEQDSGVAVIDVLANDLDPGGDAITIDAVTQGSNGSVTIDGGQILYTPVAGFSGNDRFTYTIVDPNGASATADVDVTVIEVNRGTLALANDTYNVSETDDFVVISIARTGGADGRVDADYVVIDGTAVAGQDYVAASGTVVFEDGQTVANILIGLIDDNDIEGAESFGVSLDRVGGGVGLGAPRTALINIEDDENPTIDVGNGLLGQYFNNIDFTNPMLERTDPTVDFNWVSGSPAPSIGSNTFSVRWTGEIQAEFTETYTFRTLSDDGIRLVVNGQTLIDALVNQAATSYTGSIDLVAGEKVEIELSYFENAGLAAAQLFWSSASQAEQIVPAAALFSDPVDPLGNLPTLGSETLVTGLNRPTAIEFAADGTMFILQKDGRILINQDGDVLAQPFVDHRAAVNNVRDRGALGLALHPDFPNTPYVYMAYTYDPPETVGQSGLAAPDQFGNRAARVSRWTADANTNYTTAVPGSEVVILGTNSTWDNIVRPDLDSTGNFSLPPSGFDDNGEPIRDFIATDSQSHTIGALDFGIDGNLYVSIGDGTSYGNVDPRTTRVQNIDNLSGKLLRVDPITGQGISDNPFYNGDPDSNRSKVFAYGLRNPYRLTIDPTSGDIYLGDVGWNRWEEINRVDFSNGGGENFGWPYYEGGGGGSLQQTTGYQNLSEAQAFYASNPDVEAPFWSKSHADGARAIILGDFNTGSVYAGYENALFFLDYQKPTIQAIVFNEDGTFQREVTALNTPGNVVEMSMGTDGYLYWVDLGGRVGRLTFPVA